MELRLLIVQLLAFVLYPLWLVAGAVDYLCHRRTSIEKTSGVIEGWFHVAQFVAMAIIVVGIALFEPTVAMSILLLAVALVHLALSYLDVAYTQRHRHITPLEQHVHAFLDVLPIMAVLLVAVLAVSDANDASGIRPISSPLSSAALATLIGSFAVLAGVPVLEEFLRTLRAAKREEKSARSVHAFR